ncbi:AFG2 protein [Sodiomyces alkalinus F11]|uniref:AFG2 protein n=1 Tax=Sodiomyces alkalinus (strain CBS 110278 / VKM F-3762 / F11) TaxID=1314773 RepID=A0A3N2PY14_SODAK|nr:AFG2 protein [Sodiomyces alkalinus F11]ROT39411.1 AFG2 protein [Sodiomyces alkalinus F11]
MSNNTGINTGIKPKEITVKVRPVSECDRSQDKATLQGFSRAWVNKDALIFLTGGVESGKRCWVERTVPATATAAPKDATSETAPGSSPGLGDPVRRQALLSLLPGSKMPQNIVFMTEAYRKACGFHLGDIVTIRPDQDMAVPSAQFVEAEPLDEIGSEQETASWEGAAWFQLKRAGHVLPGLRIDCTVAGFKKSLQIRAVDSKTDNVASFGETSVIRIRNVSPLPDGVPAAPKKLEVTGIPGLAAEEKKLNRFFRGFNTTFLHKGQQRSCGIVIHGGRGAGKSYVLDRIAATGWGKVFRIEENDKSSTVEEAFKQASAQRPSIILVDGLHALIGKDRPNSGTIATKLGQQLDQLAEEAWKTDTLPKVLVVASCLDYMTDVPAELQKLTRFERNIPLSIPNAQGRREILETLSGPLPPEDKESMLTMLAQQTHAFNPSDLCRLMGHAVEILAERLDPLQENATTSEGEPVPFVSREDLEQALRSTRPTAMHDVNLKPPTIHWQDVGGQEGLKKALRRMIALTTTTDPEVHKLILDPPKGLLLYGPPGCSKTLSAQAMATESGFNFFAVKGAELLNMYVGESERAVRQLFERARAASPSIIFFDEIDSIGGARSGGGGGGRGGINRSQGSVNMLTTLLTEMDGFEALTGVLILAATNRPEDMDPALLRPGRFDRVVYVGLPDLAGREAIFSMNLGRLRIADDVDMGELAELSDGFSGAEIKQICSMASNRAIDAWLDGERSGEDSVIRMGDAVEAVNTLPRGVTPAMLDDYERWARRFAKQV